MERVGKVQFFSPLRDSALPVADLIYLPGGYPEFYLEQLSRNTSLRSAIKVYAEAGGKVLAECGGMMYLCAAIIDEEGKEHEMCGILKNQATMEGMKLTLGYRHVKTAHLTLRGHEFHYSKLVYEPQEEIIAEQTAATGRKVGTYMMRYKNVIAGYTHLYWAEQNILELWN